MALLVAFKFLTVLPIPLRRDLPDKAMGRAAAYYPLVGAAIGLALVGADLALARALPVGLRSALVLALWVGLTGALHLDGFLDCCDALFAPRSPQERLEILRDPHVGAFAVVGGVLLLLVKYAALASLQGPGRLGALGVVPALGRWAMVYALVRYPYGRTGGGLGGLVKGAAGRREALVASAVALAAALVGWRAAGLAALPATWVLTALLARWITGRIGGLTGDAYGAINELVEAAWLVAAVAAGVRA